MVLYALTIFLSAFLLFQVQPLIAKTILAWFGGTAAVWTTCMLFFQFVLLLGYGYAHFSVHILNPRRQVLVHSVLLVLAVLLLPIVPNPDWKPVGTENPTVRILLLLGATVGLPYLLCSTTGPLVQAWYARREHGSAPYRLFALSNLGSMLALLSYPPLVEPNLATKNQAWIWSGGFALFAVLCILTGWRSAGTSSREISPESAFVPEFEEGPPAFALKVLWIALAACPSMLMLAVTNHLTQDVASVPFLWILPLSLYLLSFILTFDARGWYRRNLFLILLAPALGGLAYMQWSEAELPGMPLTVALFAASFFVACMFCHGELAARKPTPRYLTSFYLMLSIGGALGGLFVGLVAPYLFISYFELPFGIALCGVLAFLVATEEPGLEWKKSLLQLSAISLGLGVIALGAFLIRTMYDAVKGYRVVTRNFYGTLRIREADAGSWEGYRSLLHGAINHGEQWTHPDRRRERLTYYCDESGVGRTMRLRQQGVPQKVGVLGLGAGSMAAFSRSGDEYRFYEINPIVPALANKDFTYIPDSPARTAIILGDGRLSLEREPARNDFDILMMDAFSGDSIPVHLITREAFQLYFRHLKPQGVIVVHISNKFLNLEPVLARISEALQKPAYMIEDDDDESGNCFGTTYVLFANGASTFEREPLRGTGKPPRAKPGVGVWTDDYSNLFRILK